MFDFLRKLWGKGRERAKPARERVAFHELEHWFEEKSAAIVEQLQGKLEEVRTRLKQEKANAFDKLKALQNAELQPPYTDNERAKHFMHGNRKEFSRQMTLFLNAIELPERSEALDEFFINFHKHAKQFTEGTVHAQQIIVELFSKEVVEIREALKAIGKVLSDLEQSVSKTKISEIKNIKPQILVFQKLAVRKKELEHNKQESAQKLAEILKQTTLAAKAIEELENSEGYQSHQNEISQLQSKIKHHEDGMLQTFSILQTPMKKYARMREVHKEFVEEYLANPIQALVKDSEFEILKVLQGVRKALERKQIELKEHKQSRTMQELSEITKERLSAFVKEHAQLKKQAAEGVKRFQDSKEIRTLHERKQEVVMLENARTAEQQRLAQREKELRKIDLDKDQNELVQSIAAVTQREIVLF